jgi:quercetin dioxygenase-like cupin family protein
MSDAIHLKSWMGVRSVPVLFSTLAVSIAAGAAFLTPSNGVICYPTGCLNAVRGLFQGRTEIKFKIKEGKEEVLRVADGGQVAMHEITVQPSSATANGMPGSTGWHSHPGPVVVIIKSGTMSFYEEDCTLRIYQAGDAFIDEGGGHVHLARNEGTVDLVLTATYFGIPPGGAYRLDRPQPEGCPLL